MEPNNRGVALQVAWQDWDVWKGVCDKLFPDLSGEDGGILLAPFCPESSQLGSIDPNQVIEYIDGWKSAAKEIQKWKLRNLILPKMLECTMELVLAVLMDWENEFQVRLGGEQKVDQTMLRISYSLAIIRIVNLATDEISLTDTPRSVLEVGTRIGIPRWIVDIRHAATHHQNIPSIQLARLAIETLLVWVRSFYWIKQMTALEDSHIPSHAALEVARSQFRLVKGFILDNDNRQDDIDDTLARIFSEVKHCNVSSTLVPALVEVITEVEDGEELVEEYSNVRFFKWERVFVAVEDNFPGVVCGTLDKLCEKLCYSDLNSSAKDSELEDRDLKMKDVSSRKDIEESFSATQKSRKRNREEESISTGASHEKSEYSKINVEASLKRCLAWVSYFISRRWFSFEDASISVYRWRARGESRYLSKELLNVYPLNWTKRQREWYLSPAPPKYQDAPSLLKWLRFAFKHPHTWCQRLIASLLPALCSKSSDNAIDIATDLIRMNFGTDKVAAPDINLSVENLEEFLENEGELNEGNKVWKTPTNWIPCAIGSEICTDIDDVEISDRDVSKSNEDAADSASEFESQENEISNPDPVQTEGYEEVLLCTTLVSEEVKKRVKLLF